MTENQKFAGAALAMIGGTALLIAFAALLGNAGIARQGSVGGPSSELGDSSAQESVQRQEREAQAQAERRQSDVRETVAAARGPKERYYRDSHGAIISETEAESQLWQLRSRIASIPDTAERAYMEGALRALEEEWARIKRQGPIER